MRPNLQSSQDLINEELDVIICQLLTLDDIVEVCSHQVSHQIPVEQSHHDTAINELFRLFEVH